MKKSLLIVGAFLLIQFLTGLLFSVAYGVANGKLMLESEQLPVSVLLLTLFVSSVLSILATILICRRGWLSPFKWKIKSRSTLKLCALSILATLPLAVFCNTLNEILALEDLMQDDFSNLCSHPLSLMCLAVVGPLSEEVCFRFGILGSLLKSSKLNKWVAILLAAAVFGVIHLNPAQIFGAMILGTFFCWLYAQTKSIWPAFCCHVVNNGAAVILMQTAPKDLTIAQTLPPQFELWMVLVFSILLSALTIWPLALALRKQTSPYSNKT